jgi:hypothetical protein
VACYVTLAVIAKYITQLLKTGRQTGTPEWGEALGLAASSNDLVVRGPGLPAFRSLPAYEASHGRS